MIGAVARATHRIALREAPEGAKVRQAHRKGVGRRHRENRLGEAGHLDHRPAVLVVHFGVATRMPRDLPERAGVIVDAPEIVAPQHWRKGAVERQDLEAVRRQVQLADDLGSQEGDHVRADGELEAREDLLGDRGAADDVPAFEDEHRAAGARQVRGRGQSVVARTDHDRVVGLGHADIL